MRQLFQTCHLKRVDVFCFRHSVRSFPSWTQSVELSTIPSNSSTIVLSLGNRDGVTRVNPMGFSKNTFYFIYNCEIHISHILNRQSTICNRKLRVLYLIFFIFSSDKVLGAIKLQSVLYLQYNWIEYDLLASSDVVARVD